MPFFGIDSSKVEWKTAAINDILGDLPVHGTLEQRLEPFAIGVEVGVI
jgi:hypothetical protein